MALGKETFGLNKTEFNEKIGRIIKNFRASSKLIGEPRDFVLRACKLTDQWGKMASDPDVVVYLRNIDTAGGRKVKMISLERGGTKQPVPKAKLVSVLYPAKKIATTATPEEKHYNAVKAAMRGGITYQLRAYRDSCSLPCVCYLSGKQIRPGMKTDIDHIGMTFSEICDEFVREKCINYSRIVLKGPPTAKVFADSELWGQWITFHMEKARYSITLSSANRSKGADGYTTDPELYGSFAKEDPEDLALDF
jgi:hypothetical protein